jgi:hypothetical protein
MPKITIVLLALLLFFDQLSAQPCPKDGDATTPEKKQLNVFKTPAWELAAEWLNYCP